MSASDDRFLSASTNALARMGAEIVRPHIPSKTLQRALEIRTAAPRTSRGVRRVLYIDHYWAVYVHDGRRAPFGPGLPPSFLIWFRNPKDDPRLNNGVTPPRAAQLRHLTYEEFKYWLARYREGDPRVIFRGPSLGPGSRQVNKSTPGAYFFENGPDSPMHQFVREARQLMRRRFRGHVMRRLGPKLLGGPIPAIASMTDSPLLFPPVKDRARGIL